MRYEIHLCKYVKKCSHVERVYLYCLLKPERFHILSTIYKIKKKPSYFHTKKIICMKCPTSTDHIKYVHTINNFTSYSNILTVNHS